jgi:hypothetical protein
MICQNHQCNHIIFPNRYKALYAFLMLCLCETAKRKSTNDEILYDVKGSDWLI